MDHQTEHVHPGGKDARLDRVRLNEIITRAAFGGRRRRAYARLIAVSGAKPGDRVLDVGSGGGYLARMLAAAVGPDGQVTGIDPSAEAVSYARRRAAANCIFRVGVAQDLDLPDRSLDVVTSTLATHHIAQAERAAAFSEMFRVLRPGGVLLAADFRPANRRRTPHAFASAKRHGSTIPLEDLAAAAGFRVEARGELPLLRYVRAVRPAGGDRGPHIIQPGDERSADMQLGHANQPAEAAGLQVQRNDRRTRAAHDADRPPGPRGAEAARTLARIVAGRPLEACAAMFARYGDTVYLPVRPWEGLYLFSRPEQAEHVLAANQGNYVKPFPYRPLRMMLGDGLVTAEDPLWRRHRRIIQPVFSTRNVLGFASEMDAAAQRAVARWNRSPTIDLAAEISNLTLDVVGRALFGADLITEAPRMRRSLASGQRLALLGAFLPVPQGPVATRVVQRMARPFGAATIQGQIEQLIRHRQEQSRTSAAGAGDPAGSAGPRDLLGLLTAARDSDGGALSGQEIRDEIATFLVAGHETTAMALTWSLALLSAYPQARQQLEDEVDAVLGDGPADPATLPCTTAVISEAMRLYPPAWTLERTAVADDDVCGTPVPAGSMVAVLPYLVHRNPAVWPNPSGFDPRRFLPGAPERHRYAWLPFGGGRRACIGAAFARQEAVLVLARLCRHYRLDMTSPEFPRARGFVTLRPAGTISMYVTHRD